MKQLWVDVANGSYDTDYIIDTDPKNSKKKAKIYVTNTYPTTVIIRWLDSTYTNADILLKMKNSYFHELAAEWED